MRRAGRILAGVMLCLGCHTPVWAQAGMTAPAPLFGVSSSHLERNGIDEDIEALLTTVKSAVYLACIEQSDADVNTVPEPDSATLTTFITANTQSSTVSDPQRSQGN